MKRIDIVNELCAAIEQDWRSTFNIAQAAGVCETTIQHWLNGKTDNPKVDTLDAVARVLGKQLAFIDGQWTLRTVITPVANAVRSQHRARMALWRFQ